MKRMLLVGMAIALATTLSAQAQSPNASPQSSSPKPQAPKAEPASKPATAAAKNVDANFVTKAAEANMAEVEVGKLAAAKASNNDVKSFAKMMVDDHSKAVTELKGLAQQKNIKWPVDLDHKDKALKERLSSLSGPDFDRVYMQAMASGHRNVANEVRSESRSGKDLDVKAWAAKTLPTVEEHLKKAEDLNKTIAKSTNATH